MKLYTKILIGMAAGVLFGLLAGPKAVWVEPIGKIFIRLITMVVVPLVFASLALGTASLGSLSKLGRIGVKTISYYMITTAMAIALGLLLANFFKPGAGLDEQMKARILEDYQGVTLEQIAKAAGKAKPLDILLNIVPTNPVKAMVEGDMLGLIFFSLALGIALTYLPKSRSQPMLNFLDSLNEAIIQLVHLIMKFDEVTNQNKFMKKHPARWFYIAPLLLLYIFHNDLWFWNDATLVFGLPIGLL